MAIRPGIKVADRFEVRRLEREAPAYQAVRAFDLEANAEVALWLVRPELLPSEMARHQFTEDVQRARAFFHLNVRRIYAGGEDPRGCWVTLPKLGGQTLAQSIRSGRPTAWRGPAAPFPDGEGSGRGTATCARPAYATAAPRPGRARPRRRWGR